MSKRENKFIFVRKKKNDPARGGEGNFGLGRPFYFDDRFNRLAMMGTLISTIILLTFRQVTHSGTGSVLLDGVLCPIAFLENALCVRAEAKSEYQPCVDRPIAG